ncbi:BQ2448_7642 [Microbotryum intermedium]|uniref:BQ2448_7642 protein n=1 Tax=Microbotryum intermedium TaxID=269621 RepID=A0A238FRM1_9BASI|nr:BQ2448_7642 [Microbotryum intermedium]
MYALSKDLLELTIVSGSRIHVKYEDVDVPLVLPNLQKLSLCSNEFQGVYDLSTHIQTPRLDHLHVLAYGYDRRHDLGPLADALLSTNGPRLRTLDCFVWVDERLGYHFLDALVKHLPLCTSLEVVRFEINDSEWLTDCLDLVGSNCAIPCRTLKISRRVDSEAPVTELWDVLKTALGSHSRCSLEEVRVQIIVECVRLASEIPELAPLAQAAKRSRQAVISRTCERATFEELGLHRSIRDTIYAGVEAFGFVSFDKETEGEPGSGVEVLITVNFV